MVLKPEVPTVYACLKGMVAGGKGYGISHSWDGTVLTVTSDSGSSSADLVGPAGAELFVVNVTEDDGGVYHGDKAFAEVRAAIDRGEVVMCEWSFANGTARKGQLTTDAGEILEFTFHSVFGEDEYLMFYSDERIVYMAADGNDEKMPAQVTVTGTEETVTVVAQYGDSEEVTVIALDEDGRPMSVSRAGKSCVLTWEGFDE